MTSLKEVENTNKNSNNSFALFSGLDQQVVGFIGTDRPCQHIINLFFYHPIGGTADVEKSFLSSFILFQAVEMVN